MKIEDSLVEKCVLFSFKCILSCWNECFSNLFQQLQLNISLLQADGSVNRTFTDKLLFNCDELQGISSWNDW